MCGHLDLFDLLINADAPIHTADVYGAYPIHYAAQLSAIDKNDEMSIDPSKGEMNGKGIDLERIASIRHRHSEEIHRLSCRCELSR